MMVIRERERRQASPPEGMSQEWTEFQVIEEGRILSRHDTRDQAERWIAAALSRGARET